MNTKQVNKPSTPKTRKPRVLPESPFFGRRHPAHWFVAKQKEDVLDSIIRLSDLSLLNPLLCRPLAIINGSFDLLHSAHLRLISEARWRAGTLVALLDSDDKIRSIKGLSRPILSWQERSTALFYCGIDLIVEINSDDEFLQAVESLQPDLRFLGTEYKGRSSRIAHIHTVYITDRGAHTTDILNRIISKAEEATR